MIILCRKPNYCSYRFFVLSNRCRPSESFLVPRFGNTSRYSHNKTKTFDARIGVIHFCRHQRDTLARLNKRRSFSSIANTNNDDDSAYRISADEGKLLVGDDFLHFNNKYDDGADTEKDNDNETGAKKYDDLASFQPWKALLEIPARAAWRTTDPLKDPPEYLMNVMNNILDQGERTSKQLKRAHRKVLSIQSNLADLREKERRNMVNDKRRYNHAHDTSIALPAKDKNKSRNELKDTRNTGNLSSQTVYYGYDETLGNLAHRLKPNFCITKRILMECQSLLGNGTESFKPRRILDFGIGCGSASAAAIDLFSSSSTIEWIHGIDPSKPMRECSKNLIDGMTKDFDNPPRITFSNSLSTSSSESSSGTFDLSMLVYTSSDLPNVMSCLAAAAMSFEKLKSDGGVFIMIEPGTPDGFNSIRAVRNMLLDCCPPDDPDVEWEERCHIIAPCTHNGKCPMERHKKNHFSRKKPIGKLGKDVQISQEIEDESPFYNDYNGNDEREPTFTQDDDDLFSKNSPTMFETKAFDSSFCSFVHSVSSDSRKKGEKFSYLVAQKKKFRRSCTGENDTLKKDDIFGHDDVTDLLTKAFKASSQEDDDLAHDAYEMAKDLRLRYIESESDDLGLELLRGEIKRQSMGRIIRAPIKKKGHVYIDYCASPGRIIRSSVTKASSNNVAPGIYSSARKSRWGGLWPDIMDKLLVPR